MKQDKKVSTAQSYVTYKELTLSVNQPPVCKSVYLKIVNGFFLYLMTLVFDGHEVKLPLRCGSVYIRGRKQKPRIGEDGQIKGLAPDWVRTKILRESNPEAMAARKVVYHLNEHTNGIRYAIKWSKKNMLTENKCFYALIFSRTNKRKVNELVMSNKEYIVENN